MPDDDRNHRQGADPVEKNQSPALTRTVAQLPVTVNENIHCNKKKTARVPIQNYAPAAGHCKRKYTL
jgi:hypothetical protein